MSALGDNRGMPGVADGRGFSGPLYSWWAGDLLPALPPILGFSARRAEPSEILSLSGDLQVRDVDTRLERGHVPYVASLGHDNVAWGWSAWREADIGELGIRFVIPASNRYLWDFVTLPSWRGQGIYPRLLQEIVLMEAAEAGRFWIGHEPENAASARGILRAGFRVSGKVWFRDGKLVFLEEDDRSGAAAALLGLPLVAGT